MPIYGCPLQRQSNTNEVWIKPVDVGNSKNVTLILKSRRDKALLTSKCAFPRHKLTTSNSPVDSRC